MSSCSDGAFGWIHCGRCLKMFEDYNKISGKEELTVHGTELLFYVCGCGHIACKNCVQPIASNARPDKTGGVRVECVLCGERCFGYPLDGKISPQLQEYIKPVSQSLESLCNTLVFQESSWASLVCGLSRKVARQRDVIRMAKEELENAQEIKKKYQQLKEEYRKLAGETKENRGPATPVLRKRELSFDSPLITPSRSSRRSFDGKDRGGFLFTESFDEGPRTQPAEKSPSTPGRKQSSEAKGPFSFQHRRK
ncbi:MAG: uncharacterized protein A8A55_0830 [Amphiamblys sp. WSBS2006]|nr:MAG: uncharacterized protein A8A55_0830 [Amphiamblys sp. WSBS2006]